MSQIVALALIAAIPSTLAGIAAIFAAMKANEAKMAGKQVKETADAVKNDVAKIAISVDGNLTRMMDMQERTVRTEEQAKAAAEAATLAKQVALDTQAAINLQTARDAPPPTQGV